jgi:hypothetical protein
MITVLLWKKSWIDLFIERLDIVLSDFCPVIAVALPVLARDSHIKPDSEAGGLIWVEG